MNPTPTTAIATLPAQVAGFREGVPAQDYHADRLIHGTPTLSRSCAKTILTRSPLHAMLEHPRFGGTSAEVDAKMLIGGACHELVLGKGAGLAVGQWDAWRKDEAKAFRETALADGLVPLTPAQFAHAKEAADAIRAQLDAAGMESVFRAGDNELVAVFQDNDVWCRVMFDNIEREPEHQRCAIFDLKTTEDASFKACERRIGDGLLALQEAFYVRAVEALHPNWAGRIKYRLVFAETEPPYAIQPIELSGAWGMIGRAQYRRALFAWKKALSSGHWPAYHAQGFAVAEPKPWELAEVEAHEAST